MTSLRNFDRALAKLEEVVLFGLLLGLLGMAVVQVLWRNVVQPHWGMPPLLWADELLKHGTLMLGLLGAALATQADKHIRLDLLARVFAKHRRLELVVGIATRAATVAVCVLIAQAGIEQVRVQEEAIAVVLHPWQWQLVIPVAFGLVVLHLALRLIFDAADLLRGEP